MNSDLRTVLVFITIITDGKLKTAPLFLTCLWTGLGDMPVSTHFSTADGEEQCDLSAKVGTETFVSWLRGFGLNYASDNNNFHCSNLSADCFLDQQTTP